MSLRLYLHNGDHITAPILITRSAFGYSIYDSDSPRPYIIYESNLVTTEELPEQMQSRISRITYHKGFSSEVKRAIGKYVFGKGIASLTGGSYDRGRWQYQLHIETTGESAFADAKRLYIDILAGDMLPDLPYDRQQKSKTMRAFDHWKAIWDIISMPTRNWFKQLKDKWVKRYNNA